jgi:hypothetical protein
MKRRLFSTTAIVLAFSATGSFAQTKWDLAAAYPATNFHTENMVQLASDVDKASRRQAQDHGACQRLAVQGALKSSVPCRAAKAQMGEILLANFHNEWQLFGRGWPALPGRQLRRLQKALRRPESRSLKSKLGKQGMMLLYSVAVASTRHLHQEAAGLCRRPQGHQVARLQPRHRAIAELVGAQPVTVQAAEF